jgi:hypothetical protein
VIRAIPSVTASPSRLSISPFGTAQQAQQELASLAIASSAQDIQTSKEQRRLIVRQGLAIGGPGEDCAQSRTGFLDPGGADPDCDIGQLPLGGHDVEMVFDRTQIGYVFATAKKRFQFPLLHAVLLRPRVSLSTPPSPHT